MNKLEINTEEQKYLLDGKPIDNATEIDIKISAGKPPEAKITRICESEVNLRDCELTEQYGTEDEKSIDAKVDHLILHMCDNIESLLNYPDPLDESTTATMASALAELLKARKSFDSNTLKQTLCDILSQETAQELF